jgi:hypothetical protein
MIKEILIGFYINVSMFLGTYFLISSFVSQRLYKLELILFTYLLYCNNIIFFFIFLKLAHFDISSINLFVVSQIYLFAFFLLHRFQNIPIKGVSLKSLKKMVNKIMFIFLLVLFVDIIVNLYTIYISAPTEPDSLAYHLQAAPNWYQMKNIGFFVSNEQRTMLFSDNLNFFSLWYFLSFQNDALIEIAPYMMLIFGSLSLYILLQSLYKNSEQNFICSLLYYFGGSYLNYYSKSFTGDVGIASFSIISLTLLSLSLKRLKLLYYIFFSISNGLLLGSKMSGIFCVFLIYVVSFLKEFTTKTQNKWTKWLLLNFFSFFLSIATGGYFYLRNYYYFQNPLYGKKIDILNLIHLPGMDLPAFQAYGFDILKAYNLTLDLTQKLLTGVLGQQVIILYLPTLIILLLFFRKNIDRTILYLISYPIIYSGVILTVIGQNPPRYFFIIYLTGIVCLTLFLQKFNKENVAKFVYQLIIVFLFFVAARQLFSNVYVKSLFSNNFSIKPEIVPFYDGDSYFFFRNIHHPSIIAYLLPENSFLYPFYGSRYENKLLYVNTYNYDEVVSFFIKSKAEYFMDKNPRGDSSSLFFVTDLENKRIEIVPEKKILVVTEKLLENGVITPLGTGTRINFYKINTKIYDQN